MKKAIQLFYTYQKVKVIKYNPCRFFRLLLIAKWLQSLIIVNFTTKLLKLKNTVTGIEYNSILTIIDKFIK